MMPIVNLKIQIDAEGNVSAINDASKALDNLDKDGAKARARLREVEQAQNRLANTAGIMGGAIVAASYKAAEAASDLAEAGSAVEAIYGEAGATITKFASTSARDLGMSRRQALEASAGFGQLFQTIGKQGPQAAADMSVGIVQIASDWASFRNMRPEDTLVALRSGLIGEIEPLRNLGISFNEANVEAQALEMGLAGANGEISEGAKMQARYALIMEQSGQVSGDFARTADGMANSQRIMAATTEDTAAAIGEALTPAFGALMQAAVPAAELIGAIAQTPLGRWAIVAGAGMGTLAIGAYGAHKAIGLVKETVGAIRIVLEFYRTRVLRNTAAVDAETAALKINTVETTKNAAAHRNAAGARGAAGGAGAGAAAKAGAAGTAAVVGGVVATGATGAVIGYDAAGRAQQTRSTGAQAAYGAGGVVAGAAGGAAVGALFGGVGAVPGALIGAGGAYVAGTGRMAYGAASEYVGGRRRAAEVGRYQEQLQQMSPQQRRAYVLQQQAAERQARSTDQVTGEMNLLRRSSAAASDELAGHSLTTSAAAASDELDGLTESLRRIPTAMGFGSMSLEELARYRPGPNADEPTRQAWSDSWNSRQSAIGNRQSGTATAGRERVRVGSRDYYAGAVANDQIVRRLMSQYGVRDRGELAGRMGLEGQMEALVRNPAIARRIQQAQGSSIAETRMQELHDELLLGLIGRETGGRNAPMGAPPMAASMIAPMAAPLVLPETASRRGRLDSGVEGGRPGGGGGNTYVVNWHQHAPIYGVDDLEATIERTVGEIARGM